MKMVKIKKGTKTIYKMVPDDWKEEEDGYDLRGDLTTGENKIMSYTDVPQEKWDRIFGKRENK